MNHRETLVGQLDGECHRGNTQHTGSDASPGVQRLIDHQVGTRLLERRQQGSGHGLGGDISEEPDHEIESTDAGVSPCCLAECGIQPKLGWLLRDGWQRESPEKRWPDSDSDLVAGIGAGEGQRH